MGYGRGAKVATEDQRALLALPRLDGGGDEEAARGRAIKVVPKDGFHVAYLVYFTLGVRFLLPWNTFITALLYLYPAVPVDRVFSVVYLISCLLLLLIIIRWHRWRLERWRR